MRLLDILDKLKAHAHKKKDLEYVLAHLRSSYHDKTLISIDIKTRDFDYDKNSRRIAVDEKMFAQYVRNEIERLDTHIANLMDEMMTMKEEK